MAYNCYADPNPSFYPAMRLIAAITQAYPAEITTTFAHGYGSGLVVRLVIPPADGMQQANGLTGAITVTGSTTFTLPLDTTNFDPFSVPSPANPDIDICAMVIPIGEINELLTQATVNTL